MDTRYVTLRDIFPVQYISAASDRLKIALLQGGQGCLDAYPLDAFAARPETMSDELLFRFVDRLWGRFWKFGNSELDGPYVITLLGELQERKYGSSVSAVVSEIMRRVHPEWQDLEDDVVCVLNRGKVPQTSITQQKISSVQRLVVGCEAIQHKRDVEAAYRDNLTISPLFGLLTRLDHFILAYSDGRLRVSSNTYVGRPLLKDNKPGVFDINISGSEQGDFSAGASMTLAQWEFLISCLEQGPRDEKYVAQMLGVALAL